MLSPWGRSILIAFLLINTIGLLTFTYYYAKYNRVIEQKLAAGPYANTSMVFGAPEVVMVGDELTTDEVVSYLREAGYGTKVNDRMGYYHLRPDAVEIFPGPDSYFDQEEPGVIKFSGGRISQIVSLRDNT